MSRSAKKSPARSRTRTTRSARGKTLVLVATRKGAWIFHGDASRRTFRTSGPHFLGHVVNHLVLDPRDGRTLLAAAPVVVWALGARSLGLVYLAFFLGMLLLFVNTSPVNALTVSALPASVRATGVGLNVFLIHLMGDAISPELVGRRADALHAVGLSGGDALARALALVLPAIVLSGVALWWARHRPAEG